VTPILRRLGHEVFTPTLTGVGERIHLAHPDVDLETHITDVVNVIRYEDLGSIVLVGWSYGGMVVSGVRDRLPEPLTRVIYLDAEVPRDGESAFDVAGAEFRSEMEESAQRSGDGWKTLSPRRCLVALGSPYRLQRACERAFPWIEAIWFLSAAQNTLHRRNSRD
jgi:pimeloyl-ACP methyl ester carboxylesterase